MHGHLKGFFDWVAGLVAVATFMQWVNVILAIPAVIYTCLRIYEWFEKRHHKKLWFKRRSGH